MSEDKGHRRFDGEGDDPGKALKKWKTWAQAKLVTLKDIKPEQRGPWILTLLDGRAWDACEHLTLDDLAVSGGDKKIWEVLQKRFPEKEAHDLLGESLGEVFALSANEAESIKQWTARAREVFDRCERRAGVAFPAAAQGWITLNCAGLTEEQKAIVKAKTQGSLDYEAVAAAMRSCFPLYKATASRRKPVGALQVDVMTDEFEAAPEMSYTDDAYLQEVEAFIAEHEHETTTEEAVFTEQEAAEALAVTWKERRKEIAKVQKSRQFGSHGTSKRQFKVEVEELKRRTKCNRCGKVGHWARECRQPPSAKEASSSSTPPMAANYVESSEPTTEAGYGVEPTFVGHVMTTVFSAGLISSPGFGVLDSGCGRTLIGEETLKQLEPMIKARGFGSVQYYESENVFRFGNGATEVAKRACRLPVGIANKFGLIDAAIIAGSAPLLLGRPTLEKMAVKLDFAQGQMELLGCTTDLKTNEAGQLLVDVLAYPARETATPKPRGNQHDRDTARSTKDDQQKVEQKAQGSSQKQKTKITLKKKECRCLLAQMKRVSQTEDAGIMVAELFSPPRFSTEAVRQGGKGIAYDIKQGWDLSKSNVKSQVDAELDRVRPRLLVACPPCTHRGGWEHLNRTKRSPFETALLIRASRDQVRFALQQIRKQISRGGDFIFEHPWGSEVWDDGDMITLRRKYGVRRVDMCAYGLKCPDTGIPIRKATGILSSIKESTHFHQCQGCEKHRLVEGKLNSGQNVSDFAAEYTPSFVKAMLKACQAQQHVSVVDFIDLAECEGAECLIGEIEGDRAGPEQEDAEVIHADHTQGTPSVLRAVRKLHVNLGHPHNRDLVRILQHSKASKEALEVAKNFTCTVCSNHKLPHASLPAKTSRIMEFNARVGMDVKYLPGWKPNQRVPCISIVDYASSLHIMAPIFQKENAELLKGVLRDSWIAWAGPPKVLELDPSRPNLSDALGEYCEGLGIDLLYTAADSHWQLGKVERHGGWFEKIFSRVCEEHPPKNAEEFVDNVLQTQIAKNTLITEAGASPFQIVFGRNPRIPQDLLQDDPHLPAVDATESDSPFDRAHLVRQAARQAVLECQDHKALKAAIRARPRLRQDFCSGDWVYYWRSQKWSDGQLLRGGRWHGAGMILGKLGVNYIVAHRRSLFRCSPEHLRHATSEEKTVADFDDNELLGIKNLLEKGQFPKGQFVDLVNTTLPPSPEISDRAEGWHSAARSAADLWSEAVVNETKTQKEDYNADETTPEHGPYSRLGGTSSWTPLGRTEDYGPIRRVRHTVKSPPEYLFRPMEMQQEDLSELLQEVIPSLLETPETESFSPRGTSSKREASADIDDGPRTRSRTERYEDEALLCSFVSPGEEFPVRSGQSHVEALIAGFLQKRAAKEIPSTGNPSDIQEKVDGSKITEWETLSGKQAVRVWTGQKAKEIKQRFGHRFIGSRFVVINKKDEDGERVKSRWCLQGHLDPDFQEKIQSGACHSPTLHPLSRSLILQILVSKQWTMQLGDIKGAFLEAGPLNPKFSPLYAHQPPGGIPGLSPDDVIEVTGNVYGSNDAPFNWWFKFDETARKIGWVRSQFDNCLYYLPDPLSQGAMCGVMGAHVDDTITGGHGATYDSAIQALKTHFPYRKWRIGNGEFCGVQYSQDMRSFEITYHQKEYAEHLRAISLSKERLKDKESLATDREISALRAINGACNWLSSQSRPDLCVQTSFSQQSFPQPRVRDLLFANQLVHRAKQFSHTDVTVKSIPWEDLAICFHSDAGFGNAKQHKTQAGFIAAFVSKRLVQNEAASWSPFAWRSYKLPRVVASTLAGEAQAFTTASATAEWMSLLIAEAKHGRFDLRTTEQVQTQPRVSNLKCRDELDLVPVVGVTDCKSLYDHMISMSSVSKCEDKRIAIDLAILKQCMSRTGLVVRWCPTQLMLADALTKDQQDPADLLRAALSVGEYQLNPEAMILELKKNQRQARVERRALHEAREAALRRSKPKQKGS